jgi:hypothetical protein
MVERLQRARPDQAAWIITMTMSWSSVLPAFLKRSSSAPCQGRRELYTHASSATDTDSQTKAQTIYVRTIDGNLTALNNLNSAIGRKDCRA